MDQTPDYNFILNQQKPAKGPLLKTNSLKQRLLIVVGGGLGLILLGIVGWTVLSSINSEKFDDLVSVGKTEQKILFISNLALSDSQSTDTKALAATVSSTMSSNNYALQTYLQKRGQKNLIKQIGDGKDTNLQTTFDKAAADGTVDSLYASKLDELLSEYSKEVKAAHSNARKKTEKDLLASDFSDVTSLQTALQN